MLASVADVADSRLRANGSGALASQLRSTLALVGALVMFVFVVMRMFFMMHSANHHPEDQGRLA